MSADPPPPCLYDMSIYATGKTASDFTDATKFQCLTGKLVPMLQASTNNKNWCGPSGKFSSIVCTSAWPGTTAGSGSGSGTTAGSGSGSGTTAGSGSGSGTTAGSGSGSGTTAVSGSGSGTTADTTVIGNYTEFTRTDKGGNDIKTVTTGISDCKGECDKDSNCKGVVLIPSSGACLLKSDVTNPYTWDDRTMYVKAGVATEAAKVWTPQGHWRDNPGRTIPNSLGMVTSVQACKDKAEAAGYNVIGLQSGGECYGGTNMDYSFLGAGAGTNELGDGWDNNVFTLASFNKTTKNQAALNQPFMIKHTSSGKYISFNQIVNGNKANLQDKSTNYFQVFKFDPSKAEIEVYDTRFPNDHKVFNADAGNINGGSLQLWDSNNNDWNNKFNFNANGTIKSARSENDNGGGGHVVYSTAVPGSVGTTLGVNNYGSQWSHNKFTREYI